MASTTRGDAGKVYKTNWMSCFVLFLTMSPPLLRASNLHTTHGESKDLLAMFNSLSRMFALLQGLFVRESDMLMYQSGLFL